MSSSKDEMRAALENQTALIEMAREVAKAATAEVIKHQLVEIGGQGGHCSPFRAVNIPNEHAVAILAAAIQAHPECNDWGIYDQTNEDAEAES